MTQARKLYLIDLAERVIWTFVEAFVGVLLLSAADMFSLTVVKSAVAAGVIAVLSLLKGLGAKAIGDSNSASTSSVVAIHTAPSRP